MVPASRITARVVAINWRIAPDERVPGFWRSRLTANHQHTASHAASTITNALADVA
jgi:hypothetical protein